MDPKNHQAIVIAIIILIVAAMFTSFGRSLFTLNTPEVVLPSASVGAHDPADPTSTNGPYQRVEVTAHTVGSVVATLSRPDSYYRELTIDTYWGTGTSSTQVQVWVDGAWSHVRQHLPSNVVRHDITGENKLYYWYEGSRQYETAPADEKSQDLAQHIPTYETVVELAPEHISNAGYEMHSDIPCIFVEVSHAAPALIDRYWVSIDSGLLIYAETEEDGRIVYRMTAHTSVQTPCPSDSEFTLPNGTVLHTVDESPLTSPDDPPDQ